MADEAPNWTPYRYAFNNPLFYKDPTGLWEISVEEDDEGNKNAKLVWQEGDNFETLSEQTGLSIDDIKSFFGEESFNALSETFSALGAGSDLKLTKFIGFEGINEALNFSNTLDCNCWGTALSYGETGSVNIQGGISRPGTADRRLLSNFDATSSPSLGDIIRYAQEGGYEGVIANSLMSRYNASNNGGKIGGTSHFATYLLKNNSGTQVFTKNGWYDGWKVMYQRELPAIYGSQMGINGSSSTFKKK